MHLARDETQILKGCHFFGTSIVYVCIVYVCMYIIPLNILLLFISFRD